MGPRWLLLCLLLLGMVGMHHFVPAEAHGRMSTVVTMTDEPPSDFMHGPHEPVPSPAHGLMHLCMAVMYVIAGLLLIGFLLSMSWPASVPSLRPQRRGRRVDRPPGLFGRDLLSSVCILRL
jgi:hypothetical protein